jgi:hypothetical protein
MTNPTQITNQNIATLVYDYCTNKSKLPDDLKKIPIGKWNVSLVTSFENVFMNMQSFDEPLDWDVSNATNMTRMFTGCEKFNQTLKWNVEKVTCMNGMFKDCKTFNKPLKWNTKSLVYAKFMFSGCKKFNQPLKWNTKEIVDMSNMFIHCNAFNKPLAWDVSSVRDMSYMFKGCHEFNQTLTWDVSFVHNMSSMFEFCSKFNSPLKGKDTPNWDVGRVNFMRCMFYGCQVFNQPLDWNLKSATDLTSMFMLCDVFNQPLKWNLQGVTEISHMFYGCKKFNQPLEWDVGDVENMSSLFLDCEEFNQPLSWDVSNVTSMHDMFSGCIRFNSELSGKTEPHWDVSRVFTMFNMFKNCTVFNQPLVWNVGRVEDMSYMFSACSQFNQPLQWNVGQVETFDCMFQMAERFDQDLSRWVIRNGAQVEHMFYDCPIRREFRPPLLDESNSDSSRGSDSNSSRGSETLVRPVRPVRVVDALAIHKFSAKIDVEKLNNFFKSKTAFDPESVTDIPNYVRVSLTTMIDELDAYRIEYDKSLIQELQTLEVAIEIDSLEKIDAEMKQLNIPIKTTQRLDKLYQEQKSLLHKIHTSKVLTKIPTYVKKIDTLLTQAQASNRKEALEEEKRVLLEMDTLDKERKKIRIVQIKKESLVKLLDRRTRTLELMGRKNLIEYELKRGKELIEKHRKDFEKIMRNVLTHLKYELFELWTTSMLYSLDYVEKQPILFKKTYMESFLKDCVHAYEGAAGMSCATGVLERFVVSLMAGCGAVLSVSDNSEYDYIKGIVENGLNKLIPEYILKWYKLHSHDPHKFTTETKEQRLENLRAYLLSFFPDNQELIDELIPQFAIDVENDAFEYKKEANGRIQFNNVYVNNVPVRKPAPRQSVRSLVKPIRKSRTNPLPRKKSVKNIPNQLSNLKPSASKVKPKSKTKKNKNTILGTAFG